MAEFLTDRLIQRHLEDARLLNWCLQTVKLTAIQTTGDMQVMVTASFMLSQYICGEYRTLSVSCDNSCTTPFGQIPVEYSGNAGNVKED
ncbi:Hypp223 [Branchiostoma lanceolatum]|uniref:Hypp223 protein n=1 Tax=Branchiostoma lanceolatum TaxID=7740 RepID=A0A8J9VYK4_BRALA|nr:Hypp223 [Branchiostoma lanceolatum]